MRYHLLIALLAKAHWCVAAPNSIDTGGRPTSSANYANDGSLGGIGGISTNSNQQARHGYIGQLTEVASVNFTGTPAAVNEGATSQITGTARLDDDTITALPGADISWGLFAYPIKGITTGGLATASLVYSNVIATLNGSYLGVAGNGSLFVVDDLPDNYGTYAGDGLPDSWQNQYFGLNNPNAAPSADFSGTGQNNLFKYFAGLNPTNPTSLFRLSIERVDGQSNRRTLIFAPRWDDRTYTPLFRTNLLTGTWQTLTNANTADNGSERTIIDLNASELRKFYRIQITYP